MDDFTIHITLHDKRDLFPFQTNKFVHLFSAHPSSILAGTFYTEVVRRYRIHTHVEEFHDSIVDLATFCIVRKLYNRGALIGSMSNLFTQIGYNDHFGQSYKFHFLRVRDKIRWISNS